MNQTEWIQRGREIYKAGNSHQWEIGDWLLEGERAYGREAAFEAVKQIAPSNKRNFFTRCAKMATLYRLELRYPALSFYSYEHLRHFPMSFLEEFIPSVAENNWTTEQVLHTAVEQFGSDPAPHRKRGKFHTVRLTTKLYHALGERAPNPNRTAAFVLQILEEYLLGKPVERRPEDGQKTAAWKDAIGRSESVGNDVPSATTQPEVTAVPQNRPTYAQRRTGQKPQSKIKIVWTTCKGRNVASLRADGFRALEKAQDAAREYSLDRGYSCEAFFCEKCQVYHVRQAIRPSAAAIDFTDRQAWTG